MFKIISALILFCSCGSGRLLDKLHAKGYYTLKDTVIIKPYEYLIVQKGYSPQYQEVFPENTKDIKISIKGYENQDVVPLAFIKDTFRLSISDTTIKEIVGGELRLKLYGSGFVNRLNTDNIDSLYFAYRFFTRKKKYPKPLVLFFWNVKIKKDSVVFSIPARKYTVII